MKQHTLGYVRVSSREQNNDRQMIALRETGLVDNNIFVDWQSGKDFERPAYKQLMRRLKQGDRLVVNSIDRLGRNYKEITEQWRIITKEIGADITILNMPLLDTTIHRDLMGTFISDIVLQLLSFVAENERNNIRQRQAEGIAAALARGVRFGQPPKPCPSDFGELYRQWHSRELSFGQFAELCGFSRSTLYRRIHEHEVNQGCAAP